MGKKSKRARSKSLDGTSKKYEDAKETEDTSDAAAATEKDLKRNSRKSLPASLPPAKDMEIEKEEDEEAAVQSEATTVHQGNLSSPATESKKEKRSHSSKKKKKKDKKESKRKNSEDVSSSEDEDDADDNEPPKAPTTKKRSESVGTADSSKGSSTNNKDKKKKKEEERKRKSSHEDLSKEVEVPPSPKTAATTITPTPSVDTTVHRIRYLNFQPSAIVCMQATTTTTPIVSSSSLNNGAGDQPTTTTTADSWVAVARENGSVQLKSASQKLRTVATIVGYQNKPVNTMAWTCGGGRRSRIDGDDPKVSLRSELPTLVGGSRDGTLFIVDFHSLQFASIIPSGGGAVFCVASLCRRRACIKNCAHLVAAGCQDGAIRIFRVDVEENSLNLVSTIPSAGEAILSLAWMRNGDDGATVLFAGVADGTIRRYDSTPSTLSTTTAKRQKNVSDESKFSSFSWSPTLRMTVECHGRATPTRVWALETLADGTLVSADSVGNVQFWDGNSGTLEQSFVHNEPRADVLTLAATADGCKVFASGIDPKIVCIQRTPLELAAASSGGPGGGQKWVLTNQKRPHIRDVTAVAIFRLPETGEEVLCSGGIDTVVCTVGAEDFVFGTELRRHYHWPHDLITLSKKGRKFIMRRDRSIDIYSLHQKVTEEDVETSPMALDTASHFLGTIETKKASNIVCSTISPTGKYVAFADLSSLMIYKLTFKGNSMKEPKKVDIDVPNRRKSQIQAMCFSNENDCLFWATADGWIYKLPMGEHHDSMELDDDENKRALLVQDIESNACTKNSTERSPVSEIITTKNDEFLLTFRSGMSGSEIELFRRQRDGFYRHWWTVPTVFETTVTAATFLDENVAPKLAVACVDYAVHTFDLEQRELCSWGCIATGSRKSRSLPPELSRNTLFPVRIYANGAVPGKLIMASSHALIALDTNQKFPTKCDFFPKSANQAKKFRRESCDAGTEEEIANESHCTMCLKYDKILFTDYLDTDAKEMMVVEEDWNRIKQNFPGELSRRLYGR